jgi:hypothetical protein
MTDWLSPSKKILLTEGIEEFAWGPAWDYQVPLARRHGTGPPRDGQVQAGNFVFDVIGTNVSAVFLDGHTESINEDWARNIIQIQPDAQ